MFIPLVVTLFEHQNYRGRRRVIVEDTNDLTLQNFNDVVSSIKIDYGPSQDPYYRTRVITFYRDINYGNTPVLSLTAGGYRNIHEWGWGFGRNRWDWGDRISSLRYERLRNPPVISSPSVDQPATTDNIPLVVQVYKDIQFGGIWATIIADVPRLSNYLGPEFENTISSVLITTGPSYPSGAGRVVKVHLYEHDNYGGKYLEYIYGETRVRLYGPSGSLIREFGLSMSGELPNFVSYEFNDCVSSIRIF
jgi:hypothetical protein